MKHRLDRTQELPTDKLPVQRQPVREADFRAGKAPVPPKRLDPTLTMQQVPSQAQVKRPVLPLRVRLRNLRSGSGWTSTGSTVLLVCWGLWTVSSGMEQLTSAFLVLGLIFGVALGLFALSRLVGSIVLERMMGRTRHSAVLSHIAIGFFLAFAGLSLLRQVEWVVTAWNHLMGTR